MDLFAVSTDRHYFKIGDVANELQVKPHVLRYWETEFRWLKPEKSKTNQRVYSKKDVDLVRLIVALLHQKRYTIDGARKYIEGCQGDWVGRLQKLFTEDISQVPSTELRKQLEGLQLELSKARELLERRDSELREFRDKYRRTSIELLQLRKELPDLFATLSRELNAMKAAAQRRRAAE